MTSSIADRMFDGGFAEGELDDLLEEAGIPHERIGWDNYDCSLELYEVPIDYRMSAEAQRVCHAAGFAKAYVNHLDKWETHYTWAHGEFQEAKGWRVSYPHKRGKDETGVWVEEVIASWPKEWFESGYAIVKPIAALSTRSKV